MNVKEIISISDARKKIFQIADDVQRASNYYILTENGRAKVALLSFDDFEA
jgi:prevent-host-death family protein